MKRILIVTLLAALTAAPAAFGEDKPDSRIVRTVIVRDGKVLEMDPGELLAGKRAFLGVSLLDLSAELRDYFGASKDAGVLVSEVEANSPAAKAGLKVGDIVLSVDGKEVDSSADLRRTLRDKKEGDTVRIDVLRGRSRQTVVATVAERDFSALFPRGNMDELQKRLNTTMNSPEWKARVDSMRFTDCGELQTRIRDLETRLKDLEKKLQK
jgi:membrane-associated protease RseP (regulator of RpoE activity)